MTWTRRNLVAAGVASIAALGAAGWGLRGLFAKHYPPTPYDDLFAHLKDREAASRLGREVLKSMPNLEASAAANTLRMRLSQQTLPEAVAGDADTGRLVDAQGWIVPETLALLGALAARV